MLPPISVATLDLTRNRELTHRLLLATRGLPNYRLVAKPIQRLGGPGLIPISFVEIRDPLTGQPVADVQAVLRAGGIPRVDEWKQKTAEYKASSIPLGRFELTSTTGVANSPYARLNSNANLSTEASRSSQHSQSQSQSQTQSRSQSQRQSLYSHRSQQSTSHPDSGQHNDSHHRANPSVSSSVASPSTLR